MTERKLIIMRGLPGSGKSTLAKELAGENGQIFSTDDFFVNDKGEYVFNAAKIGEAHKWNQGRAYEAMKAGVPLVIIDNTNTKMGELKPYLSLAQMFGYFVDLQEPTTPWAKDVEECAKRNSHGVPLETIQRMANRWQEINLETTKLVFLD